MSLNGHVSLHQLVQICKECIPIIDAQNTSGIQLSVQKQACFSQQHLAVVCLMNEVCVTCTTFMFAAVAVSSTLHVHKGVITISYSTHAKTLTLHHLHNEFTRNLLLIQFHVTLHQRPNWKYCKEETGGKYGSSTCGSLS